MTVLKVKSDLELWLKFRHYGPKRFDREVEDKYSSIYHREGSITHFDSRDRQKFIDGSESDRRYLLEHSEKNQKRSAMRMYVDEPNKDKIASRRASKEFNKWIYEKWKYELRIDRSSLSQVQMISLIISNLTKKKL